MFDISLFQYQTVVYKNQWVWRSMNTGICWEYVIIVDRLIKKRYIYFPQQCSKTKTLLINFYVAMYLFYSYLILIRACAQYNYFLDIQWTKFGSNWPSGFRDEDSKQTTPLGLLFLLCTSDPSIKKNILEGHPLAMRHQIWFQLA